MRSGPAIWSARRGSSPASRHAGTINFSNTSAIRGSFGSIGEMMKHSSSAAGVTASPSNSGLGAGVGHSPGS